MSSERAFHETGDATENVRSPYEVVRVLGVSSNFIDSDRRECEVLRNFNKLRKILALNHSRF